MYLRKIEEKRESPQTQLEPIDHKTKKSVRQRERQAVVNRLELQAH